MENGARITGENGWRANLDFGTAPGVASVSIAAQAGEDGSWTQGEVSTVRAALPSLRPRAGRNRSSTSGTEVSGRRLAPAGSDRGGDGNETGGG